MQLISIKILNIVRQALFQILFFIPKDIELFKKVKIKIINSQKYANKNKNNIIENRYDLLAEKFSIDSNKLKLSNFGGKGRYLIPIYIIKSVSSVDYLIQLPIKYKNLDNKKDFNADYRLIKICDEKTWSKCVKLKNKIKY